ncbi:thyroid receptor-interacting protein 6 [Brachionichthys hirsutus]|uniref:thyroid receptor-interacting protein 6 n=1 Tax=Brachionichthys hirsutus TaxID=412623 RepID=UPI0036049D8E
MSGPTWLPPRTLGSPDRAQMAHPAGSAIYRAPNKQGGSDFRPKYGPYDQNGGGGGVANRYMAAGPTVLASARHPEGGLVHHSPADHYYAPPRGPTEERRWGPHGDGFELMRRAAEEPAGYHSRIDADIDSLTSMLADLDRHQADAGSQLYDNVPYNTYQSAAAPQGRPSGGHPQSQYPYPPSPTPHPYPQPVPASYTTASTPTGPRFSVQVKTAQPVTYSQTGRRAEQAYAPPPPRQHAPRPSPQSQTSWRLPHQAQEAHAEPERKGGGSGSGGRTGQVSLSRNIQTGSGASENPAHPSGKQGPAATRPEEELDRLTKKLVYDMNHPPAEDYFGRCARCGDNVVGDGSGCIAMEQVFHVECFTCITCHARLRGQPFYALDKKSYCESCYISTLERCSKCCKPILDRILRAMGRAYHPRCFTCVVCSCCLDGVPFTVDAASQIHCIDDFHRKYAPRCSVCGEPIMPEQGQEETVRIVALDRSFHVDCYVCEECGLLLSSEGEGRGCYPLDGHILCKSCSARRIQDLSAKISTDC